MQIWETLLSYALEQIEAANLPQNSWVLGGGTVLMFNFEHRSSKDIDIFVNDAQLLTYLSPRLNDILENSVEDYVEQTNFIRLTFNNGEIDFIHAPSLLHIPPTSFILHDNKKILLDDPAEIIAKKIKYRGDTFKPRDVFDLATVCTYRKDVIVEHSSYFTPYLDNLEQRLDKLQKTNILEDGLREINIMPKGQLIRGNEYNICKQFIAECLIKQERVDTVCKECSR